MAYVGQEIRKRRKERGWTGPRLAVEAGIAVSSVSQIENGRRNPNSATLEKIACAFGVEVPDLYPKAEAPLPLDFGPAAGQTALLEPHAPAESKGHEESALLGASFVKTWMSYMLRRARRWEEDLPEGARTLNNFSPSSGRPPEGVPDLVEELYADPQLAFEILRRSEMALSELTALLEALAIARGTTQNADASEFENSELEKSGTMRVWMPALDPTFDLQLIDAADKWNIAGQAARDVVSNTAEVTEELAQAMERSKRAAQEQQKVVALFKEPQSA